MIRVMRQLLFSTFLVGLFLSSCKLEKAGPEKIQQLIIASDFLNDKDESLFKSFEKEYSIRIHILNLTVDSIYRKLEKEGYSTKIDLIILHSALDMCRFQEGKKLQKIMDQENIPPIPKRYKEKDGHWFGIGIDPYIIVARNDSNNRFLNYNDLIKSAEWTTNLKAGKDFLPLVNGMVHRMRNENPNTAYDWAEKLFSKEIPFRKGNDSSLYVPALLTSYSSFYSDSSIFKSGYRRASINYPNQQKGGLFYALRSIGIVKQARNYTNAVELVKYICDDVVNQRMNNWWNTFPITTSLTHSYSYQNKRFKSYPVNIGNMCDTRQKAKDILNKTRKK